MIKMRPVSDLRNKFTEIEKIVKKGKPVYLTKNGYGSMVVMSMKHYDELNQNIEFKLDEADEFAEKSDVRYKHEDVFKRLQKRIKSKK